MSAIRDYFSSYDRPRPATGDGDGYIGPPVEAPAPGGAPVPTVDYGARASSRASRIRDYLAANPNRRPGPMGLNPDGSINWDESTGIGAEGARQDRARQQQAQQLATGTGRPPGPGTFNAADPRTGPAAPPPTTGGSGWVTGGGTPRGLHGGGAAPYIIGGNGPQQQQRPQWTPTFSWDQPPSNGGGGGGGI